jgi:hypothetical protein
MAIHPQQVSNLEAPTMSKHPSAQATLLEEVINHVNSSVEAIKKGIRKYHFLAASSRRARAQRKMWVYPYGKSSSE